MGTLLKKLAIAVAGIVASYYATKTVKQALERKPLKARIHDGKEKVVQLKDDVVSKVVDVKNNATEKVKNLYESDKKDPD